MFCVLTSPDAQHLAHIAAVDMARRKAARASKQYIVVNSTTPGTGLAPVTATIASGLSRASTLLRNRTRRGPSTSSSAATLVAGGNDPAGKRPASGFGFWRIPSVDSTLAEEREEQRRRAWGKQVEDDEADVRNKSTGMRSVCQALTRTLSPQIALSYQPPRSPVSFNRPISRPSSANPFDQAPQPGIHSTGYPIPAPAHGRDSPSRPTQPGIETEPVPLLRPQPSTYDSAAWSPDNEPDRAPRPESGNGAGAARNHSRMESAASGWKGPHWYGGASGGGYAEGTRPATAGVRQDRWWHALCAWGDDLDDGGEDGQVSCRGG